MSGRRGIVGALLGAGVTAFALAFSLPGLTWEKYNGDERQWILQGDQSWEHLRRGELDHPFWSEWQLLYGAASPPVAKYLIGIGLQAAGKKSPRFDPIRKPDAPTGPTYPRDVLRAARLPSAVLGAIGVLGLFLVARRLTNERAAVLAAVLLAVSPVWLASSRRAMVDIHGAALSVVALWVFLAAREALFRSAPLARVAASFAAAGAFLGLAVGAKFNSAGASIGLGGLLLVDLFRESSPGSRARIVVAGVTMGAVAVGVFVGLYPYLHHDGWNRFLGILESWRDVRQLHADYGHGAFGAAYAPGWRSFREAAGMLLLPGPAAWPWLLLPLGGAIATRLPVGGTWSPSASRLAVWALLLPAGVATVFSPGQFVHLWIAWVGLWGAALTAIVPRESDESDPTRRRAREAFVSYSIGSLVVVLATTYISWPRYYISLMPAVLVVSAIGLESLSRLLAERAGRRAAIPIAAACVFGVLSVTTAYPNTGATKIARLTADGWTGAGAALLLASVASFCLFPLVLARRAPDRSRHAP